MSNVPDNGSTCRNLDTLSSSYQSTGYTFSSVRICLCRYEVRRQSNRGGWVWWGGLNGYSKRGQILRYGGGMPW